MQVLPFIGPPSAYDIFAFVLHYRVPIFLANLELTTNLEAAICNTASAHIPPIKQTMTISSEECLRLLPSVSDNLPSLFLSYRLSLDQSWSAHGQYP